MRTVPLTTQKGGIDRLRTKGGARADTLYDALNAHVTEQYTIKPRPGTERTASLPAGTVGLTAFAGKLHVFASSSVDLSSFDDIELHILLHPGDPDASVREIHFAQPFLGALYVAAEFDDDTIHHYWLQAGKTWQAETEYGVHEFVVPTTANGFVYRARRFGDPYPAWSPGVKRTAGNGSSVEPSRIEPTVYNEYYYEAVETAGNNPRSGSVEPDWPTNTGQQIVENTDGFDAGQPNQANPPDPPSGNKPQDFEDSKYA